MYAVFRTGGKQYRASKGDTLKVEKLDAAEGDKVEFAEVLLVGNGASVKIGNPLVAGGKVQATVLTQAKAKKIEVIKFKRRQNYYRNRGHRQHFTLLEITGIASGAEKKAAVKPAVDTVPEAKKASAKKAIAKKATAKKAAAEKTTVKKKATKKTAAKKTAAKSAAKARKE
ncbi:MAG: 50S ribosomal protein L21 [Gammaproteobacteria bacterium]|nr:50S ribosomal protein L21 [Gammaproteobacteria bacterium]